LGRPIEHSQDIFQKNLMPYVKKLGLIDEFV
jgi:hypothetical protein